MMQELKKLQDELNLRNKELHVAEQNVKRLANEKVFLEQKISKLEKKVEEVAS